MGRAALTDARGRRRHSVLLTLGHRMAVLGLIIGAAFPFLALALGIPATQALHPAFVIATLSAGLLVGTANYVLAKQVVGRRLRALTAQISGVEQALLHATTTGDWSRCGDERCRLTVDSDDELGEAAEAYNRLVAALTLSHQVDKAVAAVTVACTSELNLQALCAAALDAVVTETSAVGGALVVGTGEHRQVLARSGEIDPARVLAASAPAGGEGADRAGLPGLPLQVVPLQSTGTVVGVLVLDGVPGRLGNERLLDVLSERLGVAIDNAALHQKVTELAATDELTGLDNRRHGLAQLRGHLARACRRREPVSVLMIDLDRFKQVNDTFGHLAGDRLLHQAAQVCRGALREGDLIMRYGGEEFLALLPATDGRAAAQVAERLRIAVERTAFAAASTDADDPGVARLPMSVSVGIATCHLDHAAELEQLERELIRQADLAMYAAKDAGRNCCRGVGLVPAPRDAG